MSHTQITLKMICRFCWNCMYQVMASRWQCHTIYWYSVPSPGCFESNVHTALLCHCKQSFLWPKEICLSPNTICNNNTIKFMDCTVSPCFIFKGNFGVNCVSTHISLSPPYVTLDCVFQSLISATSCKPFWIDSMFYVWHRKRIWGWYINHPTTIHSGVLDESLRRSCILA